MDVRFRKFGIWIIAGMIGLVIIVVGGWAYWQFKDRQGGNQAAQTASNEVQVQKPEQKHAENPSVTPAAKLVAWVVPDCQIAILIDPDKYEIRMGNSLLDFEIAPFSNTQILQPDLEYSCQPNNLRQGQEIFQTKDYALDLFAKSFQQQISYAGVINFPKNFEVNPERKVAIDDWKKSINDPNFEVMFSGTNLPSFSRIIFRKDPVSFKASEIQFFPQSEPGLTKAQQVPSKFDYSEMKTAKINEYKSKPHMFKNWDKIKFGSQVNSPEQIPANIKNQYPLSATTNFTPGYRFYKCVAFWLMEDTANPGAETSLIAYDGAKAVLLYDEDGVPITAYATSNLPAYYLSNQIDKGQTYLYDSLGSDGGSFLKPGIFVNLDEGTYRFDTASEKLNNFTPEVKAFYEFDLQRDPKLKQPRA